jgi:hypothetical protein
MGGQVFVDITMSLDGFITGPNDSVDAPLGEGGDRIHRWVYAWRASAGPTDRRAAGRGPTTTS